MYQRKGKALAYDRSGIEVCVLKVGILFKTLKERGSLENPTRWYVQSQDVYENL